MFEDLDGRRWHSVRDAFWEGRLNFPSERTAPEQLEFLLRFLTAISTRPWDARGLRHEMMGGDLFLWRFYRSWLLSVGLTLPGQYMSPLEGPLSDEGHSAMLMLQATREPEWIDVPMQEVIDAVRGAMPGSDPAGEAARDRFERAVAGRRNVFARETMGGRHVVSLTGFETTGRMPLRRVIWSASFGDEVTRDTLFAWLAERVDCWDGWAAMAYGKGAGAHASHPHATAGGRRAGQVNGAVRPHREAVLSRAPSSMPMGPFLIGPEVLRFRPARRPSAPLV
jgi:hypothetical protein